MDDKLVVIGRSAKELLNAKRLAQRQRKGGESDRMQTHSQIGTADVAIETSRLDVLTARCKLNSTKSKRRQFRLEYLNRCNKLMVSRWIIKTKRCCGIAEKISREHEP
jgi:hypothetical protein